MELRLLQYYLVVVQEGNISRAADALHVTQPTLSRQMGQLEEELGAQLFVRGHHLELTDAGLMLKRRAEEVTALVGKIENDFADAKEICAAVYFLFPDRLRKRLRTRRASGAGTGEICQIHEKAGF